MPRVGLSLPKDQPGAGLWYILVECVFAVGIQTCAASSSVLSVGAAEDVPCGSLSSHGNHM